MAVDAEPDALEIGRISKAHGILGELRVSPHWDASEALLHAEQIWLASRAERKPYRVERVRAVPRGYLIKLLGVDDRNAAEALQGSAVSVRRDAMPALEPGEYYLVDLIGAKVLGPGGEVGEVTNVVSHPTVDLLVVRLPDGKTVEQPLSPPWLSHVDIAARRVVLHSLDGLM